MGTFFVYILKSSVCLAAFYLFHRLLLNKDTFHRFNRIMLLCIIFLSLAIPCIKITVSHETEVTQAVSSFEQLLMTTHTVMVPSVEIENIEEPVSWTKIILLIYLLGILFFAVRHLYSLVRLIGLIKSGEQTKMENGIRLVVHEKDVSPFSWMRYIVISRKDLEENGREILIHESAHIRNRHSWDLLVADICIFFQWFNPGAWLLKQELQNIHEYEADETVLKEGVDAKQYQLLLIKKAVGTRLYSMANSFNHSKLKKRITMMLKEKSNPWARLKYLYVLPLAAIAVTAFARPEVSETVEEISALKVNDLASFVEAKVTENVSLSVKEEDKAIVLDSLKVTQKQDKKKASTDHLELGHSYILQNEGGSVMISGLRPGAEPLILINGKEVDANIWKAIEPSRVKKITAIADKKELEKYGARGKDGVFIMDIYTEEEYQKPMSIRKRLVNNVFYRDKMRIPLPVPLIIVDGKEISGGFSSISPELIESFTVLKDESATAIYGDRGKNGVILVTLKNGDMTLTAEEIQIVKSLISKGETIEVKGIVTDLDGIPVAGAILIAEGTSTAVITNNEGRFVLQAPKDVTFMVSFIGMKTIKVKASANMTVRMTRE